MVLNFFLPSCEPTGCVQAQGLVLVQNLLYSQALLLFAHSNERHLKPRGEFQ